MIAFMAPLVLASGAASAAPAPQEQAQDQEPRQPIPIPAPLPIPQDKASADTTQLPQGARAPIVTWDGRVLQEPAPAFHPINHEENYASFRDVRDANLWTKLKYIPIAPDVYGTLGGELRLRGELRPGERFGAGPQDDDGNFQIRARLWGDVHIGRQDSASLRAFVDIEHATTTGLDSVEATIDEGRADFNQAFLEARVPIGSGEIKARVGRQEVGLGGYTVFDMREGANTRRSLDLVRVIGKAGRIDGGFMIGHPVTERKGSFDDATNTDYDLWGLNAGYGFGKGAHSGRVEAIFVATDALRGFDSVDPAARDERRTLSLRLAGIDGPWNYSLEGIRQWGSNGPRDIDAYYLTAQGSYSFKAPWKPQLGLRFDLGSGDKDPNDGKLGTYGPLFPRPLTYNGDLGPHNLTILQPSLGLAPAKGLSLNLSMAGLWRTSVHDAVYSLGGAVIRSGDSSDARYFATRYSVSGRYALNPFTTIGFYTNYSDLADAFKPGRDLFYGATYVTFRF